VSARIYAFVILALVSAVFLMLTMTSGATFTAPTTNPSNQVGTATLAAPAGVSATVQSNGGTVRVAWTATSSAWASGHRVFRATSAAGPFSQIQQIAGLATVTYDDVPGVGTDFVGAASSSPNFSRASVTGTSSPNLSAGDRTIARWFNTGAFLTTAQMTPGQWGNSGRGVLVGPGFTTLDVSLFKNFKIREAAIVEFRAESFNLPNHPSWTSVGTTVGTSTFGSVTGASVGRVLQFGMKLSF